MSSFIGPGESILARRRNKLYQLDPGRSIIGNRRNILYLMETIAVSQDPGESILTN